MKKIESELKQEKFKRIWIALVLLVLLIVFGVFYASFGQIDVMIPTGNIDIFDININKCEKCDDCPVCNCETIKPVGGDTPSEEDDGKLSVFDNVDLLENQRELKIFENPAFEYTTNLIAPGVSNTYQFVVRNNNDFAIIYDVSMFEVNPENINMKYKLKQNGIYIVGDESTWGTADDLVFTDDVLAPKSKNAYSLEWKWIDTKDDTLIGQTAVEKYQLTIEFDAVEYEV